MNKSLLFILLLSSFCGITQIQQNAGSFRIKHYGVKTYKTHPRNFDITQNSDGILYFGNAYGVLEYDGETWKHIALPQGRSALSLGVNTNDKVFVGSFNELGYLDYNKKGIYQFYTLKNLIPEEFASFANISNVHCTKGKIYFQARNQIFVYSNNKITVIKTTSKNGVFLFSKLINNQLWVQESSKGLMVVNNEKLLLKKALPSAEYVIKQLKISNDNTPIITTQKGLFELRNDSIINLHPLFNERMKDPEINGSLLLDNGDLLLYTAQNGLFIKDHLSGENTNINAAKGLFSNCIHKAFRDNNGGIWLALDNGLAFIELNSAFQYWGKNSGLQGMGYAAKKFQGNIYLGTSHGIFTTAKSDNFNNPSFTQINGINEQIWSLNTFNNQLFCCTNNGLYQVKATGVSQIVGPKDYNGNWKIEALQANPNYAIKGTYEGLQLYRFKNNKLVYQSTINGFKESSRVFAQDKHDNIWVCHGNKGLYRIRLSTDFTTVESCINYNNTIQLPPNGVTNVVNINDTIVISTQKGVYFWDDEKQAILVKKNIGNQLLPNQYVNSIFSFDTIKTWVFSGNDLQLLQKNNLSILQNIEHPFKKISSSYVGSYETIEKVNNNQFIIGSQEGFTFCDLQKLSTDTANFKVVIRKITTSNQSDSILFNGGNIQNLDHNWGFEFNSFKIEFSAPYFENEEHIKYQYLLEQKNGNNNWWSDWNSSPFSSYRDLHEGKYVFKIRAKNIYGQTTPISKFSFIISPPWYRSSSAYIIYALLVLGFVFSTVLFVKRLLVEQKRRLEAQQKIEVEHLERKHLNEQLQTEKEIVELKNEKLEAEVINKNSELGNLAEALTRKTSVLTNLKNKIQEVNLQDPKAVSNLQIKEVIKSIDADLDFADDWSTFQIHFDQMHNNFLHKLRTKHPKLNATWLLFCAYIRMNKSNKEIANSMNISVSAVEKRKARLGNKLEISENLKAIDYIFNV